MQNNLYFYKVKDIMRNYDGDTIDIIVSLGFDIEVKQTVRLLDIDTDEIRGGTTETKARANLAKDKLASLVEMGQVYVKTYKDKTGKYGRLLGELFVEKEDGTIIDVNKTLVAEGYQKGNTAPLTENIILA